MEAIEKIIITASENPSLSLIIFNSEGKLEWISRGFEVVHGFELNGPEKESIPDNFSIYSSEKISGGIRDCIKKHRASEYTGEIHMAGGELKWVTISIFPCSGLSGTNDKFFIVESDVTAYIRKEARLRRRYSRMKEMTESLEKANHLLEKQKKEIDTQRQIIEEEQKKSEKLLRNILPFEVARQLKSKDKAGSRQYKMVSVFFADFKGFSKISKTLDPKELVTILDGYFARFEEITEKHFLEKIKTIGDAYMCAGGLPLSNRSNPVDAVLAGLEIQHYMNTLNDARAIKKEQVWELRIGIHTGPVVAGVIGKKRLAYDIWGDAVNVACRMEQNGHVGMVNISGATYEYVRDFFECDYRGKIQIKNDDKVDMYFVNRIKPEFSDDEFGIQPNDEMIYFINKL